MNRAWREQVATRVAFFIAGFGMAAWAPLVPYAKERAQIDDGILGLLLLCLGGGSLVAMPIAGALAARWGCRAVIIAASLLVCLTLPFLAVAEGLPVLAIALLGFGAGVGAIDVAVNIQAVVVERAAGRAMMSGFHGLFSVGGIAGAGGMSGLLWAGASPVAATCCVVAIILAALAISGRHLLPHGANGGTSFAFPRGRVLLIGLLCFIVFLTEGAVLDWGAVFLTSARSVDASWAGLGYAVFAAAMTAGRLYGDRIVHALGSGPIMVAGSLCAAAGLVLVTAVAAWPIAMLGFGLIGLGCSNIVPVLYSAIGRQRVMPENQAVAAITTLGYSGILAGPAAIGFVAQASSLSVAFLLVAASLLVVTACAGIVAHPRGSAVPEA